MTAWSELALLMEQGDLRARAAVLTRVLLEDGSAAADAYAAEHRLAGRIAAYKAAGGVL